MNLKILVAVAGFLVVAPIAAQLNDTDYGDVWTYEAIPGDHNIRIGNAFHARGYTTPYSAECTECHGQGLQGIGSSIPPCYYCHDNKWDEATPVEVGPVIYFAEFQRDDKKKGKLKIVGENAAVEVVTILNGVTADVLDTSEADKDGAFACEVKFSFSELPPCIVKAEYTDGIGKVYMGPLRIVLDKQTGQPVQNCDG